VLGIEQPEPTICEGGRMNRTTIQCPRCLEDDSDLLALIREDETGFVIGHRLHCHHCEHLWIDTETACDQTTSVTPGHLHWRPTDRRRT
jgi:hypothetical protein